MEVNFEGRKFIPANERPGYKPVAGEKLADSGTRLATQEEIGFDPRVARSRVNEGRTNYPSHELQLFPTLNLPR